MTDREKKIRELVGRGSWSLGFREFDELLTIIDQQRTILVAAERIFDGPPVEAAYSELYELLQEVP